jgi:hypothetical protein
MKTVQVPTDPNWRYEKQTRQNHEKRPCPECTAAKHAELIARQKAESLQKKKNRDLGPKFPKRDESWHAPAGTTIVLVRGKDGTWSGALSLPGTDDQLTAQATGLHVTCHRLAGLAIEQLKAKEPTGAGTNNA